MLDILYNKIYKYKYIQKQVHTDIHKILQNKIIYPIYKLI